MHIFYVRDLADDRKYQSEKISGADSYDKRDQFHRLTAFYRGKNDHKESDEAAENRKQIVSRPAVRGYPTRRRTRQAETDERDDRSDDDCGQEFIDPAGTDRFNDERDGYINQSRETNSDDDAPIAVILSDDRFVRAEEGE